jgi:hypothetical protein
MHLPPNEAYYDFPFFSRVMDKDIISSDDLIGEVFIHWQDVIKKRDMPTYEGWFPLIDSEKRSQGELQISFSISETMTASSSLSLSEPHVFFSSSLHHRLYVPFYVVPFYRSISPVALQASFHRGTSQPRDYCR